MEFLTPHEAALRTGQGEALWRASGRDVDLLTDASAFLKRIESRGPLTPYDGRIDTGRYWPSLAGYGISPTALEKLSQCPFQYFASKVLDLEDLEAPESEEEILPVEIGQIYHDVLEQFHSSKRGDLEKETDAAFERLEASRTIRYPVLWGVEKDRIRRVLRAFVDADDLTVFKPMGYEVELRGEIPIRVGGRASVAFRGFLDRLDRGPKGSFRVVDYKRRRSSKYRWTMETGLFKKGAYLQPPIYFLLAAQSGKKKVDPANSQFVYAFVEDALEGDKWELVLEGDFWERRGEFETVLRGLLETIAHGEFRIRPGDACTWCDYRTMCRKSHLPTRLRAEGNLPL